MAHSSISEGEDNLLSLEIHQAHFLNLFFLIFIYGVITINLKNFMFILLVKFHSIQSFSIW